MAMAISKMLYAADLFLIPESVGHKETKGTISRLAKIQRQASLHIMGAMKSAPADVIDTCTDLLPFQLLVSKVVHHTATRLASLPAAHPLAKHIVKVAGRFIKKHRAPDHEITHAFAIWPSELKCISPVRFGPKWQPSFPITVPTSKPVAVEATKAAQADMKVFLDGSGVNGSIGAATVLYRNSELKVTLSKHIGS